MLRLLVLIPFFLTAAPPFIFVHLGSYLPGYYTQALEQVKVFNPESAIYLLTESRPYNMHKKGKLPLPSGIHLINIDTVPHKEKSVSFRQQIRHLPQYWIYTFDRFFAIERFMKHKNLQDAIHVEGDVLIYSNFDWFLEKMRNAEEGVLMAYLNEKKAGPAVTYIRDDSSIAALTQFMMDNYRYNPERPYDCTDMSLCAESGLCGPLPVVPPGYSTKHKLKSLNGEYTCSDKDMFEGEFLYGKESSLFDPNPLGQFIDGLSPVHEESGKPYTCPVSVYQYETMPLVWKKDDVGRKVPYLLFQGKEYRVNNIHLHSKSLHKFRSFKRDGL